MKNNRKDLVEQPHFSPSFLPSTAAIETTTSTSISSTEAQAIIPSETLVPTQRIPPSSTPSSAPSVKTKIWLKDLAISNGLINTTDLIETTRLTKSKTSSLPKSKTSSLAKSKTSTLAKSKHSTKRTPVLPKVKLKPTMYIVAIAGCSQSSALEELIRSL